MLMSFPVGVTVVNRQHRIFRRCFKGSFGVPSRATSARCLSVGDSVGNRVFMLVSFTGGRRYHVMNYQDAMAMCRVFGALDFSVTFTCNGCNDTIETKATASPTDATCVLLHPLISKTKNFTTNKRSHPLNSSKAAKKLFSVKSAEDAERDSASDAAAPCATNDE